MPWGARTLPDVRTLIIQHDDNAGPAALHAPLAEAGEVVLWHPAHAPERPALEGIDAVLILGGNANPDEDAIHPWLVDEVDLLEEGLDLGLPMLGICLGGQLLARAAGGAVGRIERPEIAAFRDVGLTDEARDDILLSALPQPFFGFEWHRYGFEVPPGATLLARNEAANQAFRLQNRVWGLQFHLEVDAETILGWATEAADEVERHGGAERLAKATETFLASSMAAAREVATRFAVAVQVTTGEAPPQALHAYEQRPDPIAEAEAAGAPPEVVAAMRRLRDARTAETGETP